MEQSFLRNLKSNYILHKILEHIKNKNAILKLFAHSKYFQNKVGIKLIDYQKEFFKDFLFEKYLCFNAIYDDNNQEFDKNIIKISLRDDLLQKKFDSNNIINNREFLLYYFKKYFNRINEEELDSYKKHKILIDIYSPFFEELSKAENFNEFFTISILPRDIINKYNLKNDYINFFDKNKYSSLKIYTGEKEDFYIIDELNINNDCLNDLIIYLIKSDKNIPLFSNDKIITLKNLKRLIIDSKYLKSIKFNNNYFENINNFYLLEHLELNDIIFNEFFILKLYNLKTLFISNCKNIAFGEDKPYNIEILELSNTIIIRPKKLLKFPNLKKYFINNIYSKNYYNLSIFDIIEISTYKETNTENIHNINDNSSIEYLEVGCSSYNGEIYKKMLEKLITFNSLKYFNIYLYNIYDEDISLIQGENTSVKKAKIFWLSEDNCILYNLQNKFPELSNLILCISDIEQGFNQNPYSSIEIKENPKCKINQFNISSFLGMNIKFYIQSFESLVSVSFDISMRFNISANNFPIFNKNCKIIFKSLKSFRFTSEGCYWLDFNILNNIYNNMDCMPNLKSFTLKCKHKDITEDFLVKLINKIITMKLNYVEIFLNYTKNVKYTINELKEIWPKIDINQFNHISIEKFSESDKEDFNLNDID